MILKKKWIELLQENNVGDYSINNLSIYRLIADVDLLFTQQCLQTTSQEVNFNRLKLIFDEITGHFLTNTEEDNYWADMPIFVSSYNFKNKAPFGELLLRLTQYLGFYKKILTDKGLVRSVITHRDYSNSGSSDGNNKNFNSETPQINLTNFDDAIKYASNLTKNEDHSESETSGESDLTVSSKSWDEEEKNLKYIFYNDLCDFLRKIPQWIYSQYALDSMPTIDLVKETFNYFKDIYERR